MASALSSVAATSAFAADNLPFTYTVDFKVNLRGRDMTSDTGTFCNTWRSTFVERPDLDQGIWIQLWKPGFAGFDEPVGNKIFYRSDGVNRRACWVNFLSGTTYYFRYTKGNNGFTIRGSGTVRDA